MRQSYLTLIPSSPASIQLAKSLGKKQPVVGAALPAIASRSTFATFPTATTSASFADFSPPPVTAAALENDVLASVRKFFQSKNLSNDQINKTISNYKYQGDI